MRDAGLFRACSTHWRPPECVHLQLEDCCTNCGHLDDNPPCPTLCERWREWAGPIPEPSIPTQEVIHYLMDAPDPKQQEET